jgi:23S rRNA pseudouridine2605 synthase
MTLDRVLSRFGVASRTAAREIVESGRLKVNGRVVRDPGFWAQPAKDVLQLDGIRIRHVRKRYFLFYKPKGVITSHGAPRERKTIYDFIDGELDWVFPVGRLDKDTSGLILLTNDTEFADFVTSPASRIPKLYLVKLNAQISDETLARIAVGVEMKRGDSARPYSIRRIEDRGRYSWVEVVLTEGKNREIRRMMEAVGFKVLKLVRTRIGPLTPDGLEVGRVRELSRAEVTLLRNSGVKSHRRSTSCSGGSSAL